MKKKILVVLVALVTLVVAFYFVTQPADERDVCVLRDPDLELEDGFFGMVQNHGQAPLQLNAQKE